MASRISSLCPVKIRLHCEPAFCKNWSSDRRQLSREMSLRGYSADYCQRNRMQTGRQSMGRAEQRCQACVRKQHRCVALCCLNRMSYHRANRWFLKNPFDSRRQKAHPLGMWHIHTTAVCSKMRGLCDSACKMVCKADFPTGSQTGCLRKGT